MAGSLSERLWCCRRFAVYAFGQTALTGDVVAIALVRELDLR